MSESRDQVRNQGTHHIKKGTKRIVAKCPKCGDQTLQVIYKNSGEWAGEIPTCFMCLLERVKVVELVATTREFSPPPSDIEAELAAARTATKRAQGG